MYLSLDVIRDYIVSHKIEKNLDINKPIKSLGILKIDKENNDQKWIIRMKGPQDSFYKKGVFSITIDFPKDFPDSKPEVRILNKIYHNQVNNSNGHIDVLFILNWDKSTSITELLVGIYLFFIFPQNPDLPYSGIISRDYRFNQNIFIKKAEEYALKYAQSSKEDSLLEEISNNEITINSLKEKINQLEKEIFFIKNENQKLKIN